jgi:hypothetical protein
MLMKTIYYLTGYQGIGKTTFGESQTQLPFVDADKLEAQLHGAGVGNGPYGMHWGAVLDAVVKGIVEGFGKGDAVILEYPCWTELGNQLDTLKHHLKEKSFGDVRFVAVTFSLDKETAYSRYVARQTEKGEAYSSAEMHSKFWDRNVAIFKRYNGFFDEIISCEQFIATA